MTDRRYLFAIPWLAALQACGLPLDVRRIDQPHNVEPRGVRYVLKKPVFQPALWTNGNKVAPDNYTYEFRLAQRMVADDHVYEARVAPSMFASTEVSMALSGDGSLTGLAAGATDQLGPTLVAVATLVTGVAAFGAGDQPELRQDKNLQALKNYTEAQKSRSERIAGIEAAIQRLHRDLANGAAPLDFAAAIVALQGELERERKLLQESVFTTNAQQWCRILVGNKLAFPSAPPTDPWDPWIEVSLNATP